MFPDLLCDDVFRLETARLWLRWPRAADAAAIARLAGVADVARMTAQIPHPYPEGAAAKFILMARSENARGESVTLVLAKKRGSEPIGVVSLRPLDDGALEIGYWLGKPCWGRGLMTEAVRVLEKCGFAATGQAMVEAPARGERHLANLFRLTRDAWIDRGFVRDGRRMDEACGCGATA